jgi:chaperone modulatory protein CbpM
MMNQEEVLSRIASVSAVQLRIWVSEQWVKPAGGDAGPVFNDADIARIRLVSMLHNELEVGREAIPIILSLIDQVHDLREQMRIISRAIDVQPSEIRSKLLAAARKRH